MKKRRAQYTYERPTPPKANRSNSSNQSLFNFSYASIAIIGCIFVIGVGVGIAFSSSASFNPENVASREVIDRSAPNPELCIQYGASAIVSDMRLFVTLNPFSVYITQPRMQPGCVLRRSNWSILERQKLVSSEQVRDCKQRMNTFGFTGNLEGGSPKISCIYQNDAAGNLFPDQSGLTPRPESDNF
jgi:hypothetical protein